LLYFLLIHRALATLTVSYPNLKTLGASPRLSSAKLAALTV
jgi:hypothetical protein